MLRHVKKMLRITVCLFLGSALRSDVNAYRGDYTHMISTTLSPLPVDYSYNDNMYNKIFQTKPNTNLVFNFEQLRRDQPPQIEHREENLGLYMRRRPSTTPEPITKKKSKHPQRETTNAVLPHNRFALHSPEDPKYPILSQTQFNPTLSPPRLSTPSWPKIDQSFPHYPSRKSNAISRSKYNHQTNNYRLPSQPIISTPQPAPQSSRPMTPDFNKVQLPKSHNLTNESQKAQVPPNRGHRKFDWSDDTMIPEKNILSSMPYSVLSTSTAMAPQLDQEQQDRNTPPPVPTLSPWYGDNFGK